MSHKPTDFLIVPDKKVLTSTLQSSSSTGGARPSVATGNNTGNLTAYLSGTPTGAESSWSFGVQDSGSLYSTTFTKTMGSTNTKGEHDRRFRYNFNSPISVSGVTDTYGFGCTGFYSPNNQREYVYQAKPTMGSNGVLYYAWRNLDSNDYYGGAVDSNTGGDTWTQGTVDLNASPLYRGVQSAHTEDCQIDTAVLPNGTIVMVVMYSYDLDVYHSTDGENWEIMAEKICSRFLGRRCDMRNLRVAESGGWLKIIFAETSGVFSLGMNLIKITGMVSSDSGATWHKTDEGELTPFTYGKGGKDPYTFDMCGTGDGTFVLVNQAQMASNIKDYNRKVGSLTADEIHEIWPGVSSNNYMYLATYISSGKKSFSEVQSLRLSVVPIVNDKPLWSGFTAKPRILICGGQDWIWLWLDCYRGALYETNWGTVTDTTENRLLCIPKKSNISNTTWTDLSSNMREWNGVKVSFTKATTGYVGAQRYRLGRAKFFNSGDGVSIFGAVFDNLQDGISYEKSPVYMRFSGWHNRTMSQYYDDTQYTVETVPENPHQPTGRLFLPEWDVSIGSPGQLYGNGTWVQDRSISTAKWTPARLRLQDYTHASGTSQGYTFQYDDPQTLHYIPNNTSSTIGQTPLNNWIFGTTGTDGIFGCCVEWVCRVEEDTGGSGTANGRGALVEIQSFIESQYTLTGNDNYFCNLILYIHNDGFIIFDKYALGSPLASETIGTDELKDNWYEFRWVFHPDNRVHVSVSGNWNIPTLVNGYLTARNVLCYRKYGTDAWQQTSIITPSQTTGALTSTNSRQFIRFGQGVFSSGNGDRKTYWKNFSVSNGGDLQQFYQTGLVAERPADNARRGRMIGAEPVYIGEGMSVLWGGVGGFEGDSFTAELSYDYDPSNCYKFSSPRTKYASKQLTTENSVDFVFKRDGYMSHGACAFFGVVGTTLHIEYATDAAMTSPTTAISLSTKIKTGRITSVTNGTALLTFDGYDPHDNEYIPSKKNHFYAQFSNVSGSAISNFETYKIENMNRLSSGQYNLELDGFSLTDSTCLGTTLSIYTNKIHGIYSSEHSNQYIRVTVDGSRYFPEKRAEIGTLVLGTTLQLDVPLTWDWKDREKANLTSYSSRGGVTWSYCEGPSPRELTGLIKGDVRQQVRRKLRQMIRNSTDNTKNPVVFIQDAGIYDAERILLCRFKDENELDNQGWYYNPTSQGWEPVGDLSLTFIEVV